MWKYKGRASDGKDSEKGILKETKRKESIRRAEDILTEVRSVDGVNWRETLKLSPS